MAATMVELGFTTVDKHALRFEWPILILVAEEGNLSRNIVSFPSRVNHERQSFS